MKKNALIQLSLKTGLISGILAIIMFLTFYSLNVYLFDVTFQLDFWVPLPFVIIGSWYYRKLQGNELRFWQGFVIGYITCMLTAFISALFAYIFLAHIDPDFLEQSRASAINYFKTNKQQIIEFLDGDEASYQDNLTQFIDSVAEASPWSIALDKLIRFAGFGLFYSFIVSLILRK